jgi:hypothetical protein
MTTTISKRTTDERYTQYQYQRETERIEREHAQPWPELHDVAEVQFHGIPNTDTVVISVIASNGHITSHSRDARAAIAEAAGYAMRAGWNFSPVGELPDVFVAGFLALVEVMPVEVQS